MITEGISIKKTIGVGDAVQFSSVPENYFRTFGRQLYDSSRPWFFDYNPFVSRDSSRQPLKTTEMWTYGGGVQPRPEGREHCYLSLAERHASVFKAKVFMKYPRLYRFEDYPFEKRETILLQTNGISHGKLPEHIIDHILRKYRTANLFQIGLPGDLDIGIPKITTPTLWDLAEVIAQSKMVIGPDSGPTWIAACYPDVVVKKVRMKPSPEHFQNWVPMKIDNIHSHWDDRTAQIFNPTDDDIGFTASYRRI